MIEPRAIRRGRIAYVSDAPETLDTSRGGENFGITRFTDGRMVQRAHCRITAPPDVERDSVVAVDASLRPRDAYVRIETGGQFTGAGWYTFAEDEVRCETDTGRDGRASYHHALTPEPQRPSGGPPGGPPGALPFCSHAIVGDAWMIAAAASQLEDGKRGLTTLYTSTLNKQGRTAPHWQPCRSASNAWAERRSQSRQARSTVYATPAARSPQASTSPTPTSVITSGSRTMAGTWRCDRPTRARPASNW